MIDFGKQRFRPFLAKPDFLVSLRLGRPQLGVGDGLLDGARQQGKEIVTDRLDHIVGRASLDRLDRDLGLVGAGDIDDGQLDLALAHLRENFVTCAVSQIMVEHDDIEAFAVHALERRCCVFGMEHLVPQPTQMLLHQSRDGRIIIDIEDAESHRRWSAVMGSA